MRDRFLPVAELNSLLAHGGHRLFKGSTEDPAGIDVFPPDDRIVTVALNLDPCQGPAFRDRYFATLVDDDGFPLLGYDPGFDLPRPFLDAAQGGRSHGAFLAGPFRWLCRRLTPFPRWLLWPESAIAEPSCFVRERWVLEEMPRLRDWLQREPPVPPGPGALILDPSDASDCRVLWEVAEQVETGFYNYYVSDPDVAEVYQLHHHSKVIISIPDDRKRRRLLEDLSAHPDLLEDCSGYTSEYDDEGYGETDSAESDPSSRSEES